MSSKVLSNGAVLLIIGVLLWFSITATSPVRAQLENPPVTAAQTTASAPLLVQYQARVLDPGSG